MTLSERFHARAREIIARYPDRRGAVLPLLHEAQDEVGYVSSDVIREVAEVLDLHSADVAGVATFHTMFKRTPPGRYIVSLCTNVGCAVWGAQQTAGTLRELVGPAHSTSDDGTLYWEPVECLATCHWAPAAQVNYHDVPYLSPERARRLCDALRSGRPLEEVLAELRQARSFEDAGVRPGAGESGPPTPPVGRADDA